ncbi:MAG: histidine phosphatase family protein [Acholeplasmataceae bacterium]
MTTFILVRHGEPRYDEVKEKGIYGMAYNFGKLTDNGIEQAKRRAKDPLLQHADLIISSPFTRSLQTAANIASLLGLDVIVEHDLHEWLPEKNIVKEVDGEKAFETYMNNQGKKATETFEYETYEEVKKRMQLVLLKYTKYKKVIVVSHGIAISSLTHFDDVIEHCGVREITL